MSYDYSSDYSDHETNYSHTRSHQDYGNSINPLDDEPSGTLISIKMDPIDFEEYELYNFVESTIRIELLDLSAFKNLDGKPTGIAVAQFSEPVTQSRLRKLHGKKFKKVPVEVRLFTTLGSFQKFCRNVAEFRLQSINLDMKTSPPQVYVLNFNGDEQSVRHFFSRCGQISLVKSFPYKNAVYYTLFFVSEASAKLACRSFDGFEYANQTLVVAPLYKNAAEKQFAIHHVQDPQWLKQEISYFGKIAVFKELTDNICFVMMERLEDAKAACVLLNKKFDNDVQIKTNFIDYIYFQIGNPNL
ncbi:hypothetical protein TRFO_06145 [Tritrichomonas foetus]|uniref:RRM domain-containing protein n=1 Tax=Tritrichomonas foetus TaxID=1144522 RepID=A0A1J4K187_9EUKA|nr:hypothetical protein TRFO_06145 [Tritrichomonas foetus]|eukprot:OHT04722.1 hypothetical protein TRFO_06145 [Tritrichomonas foetus]